MNSRPNTRIHRTIAAAIAALFAASLPAVAFADDAPSTDAVQTAEAPKPAPKAKHRRHHKHGPKSADAGADADAKPVKVASGKHAKSGKDAVAKTKKSKRTASRSKKKSAVKTSDAKAPSRRAARGEKTSRRCVTPAVAIDRGGVETLNLSLTDCAGKPIAASREKLSVLARPWSVAKPDEREVHAKARHAKGEAKELVPGVRLLDPGLLVRLEAIAKHFPGAGLSIVSGYRPQSRGSQHQAGKAIDLRITNAKNEALVAFCRTLADTGCGYYPNSSFVHVDVRPAGSGSTYWIDASGPGEPPHYVSEWPPKDEAAAKNASPKVVAPAAGADEEHVHGDERSGSTGDAPERELD
jgi:hypothetical protein